MKLTFFLFFQFRAHPHVLSRDKIQEFLQDTDISMATSSRSAQEVIDSSLLSIPETIPVGSIIACLASKASKQRYWIAKVLNVHAEHPVIYKVRYFDWSVNLKAWTLQRGKNAYGTCPHESVLLFGVQFNTNGTMTAATMNHLNYVLHNNM